MSTSSWFDTHTHLMDARFDSDRDVVIQRAFDNQVRHLVEIADGPAEWDKARLLAKKYPGQIRWAAGLHPYYSQDTTEADWTTLRKLTTAESLVAIGEIGLDYFKSDIPPEKQKQAFKKALEIALKEDKPVILHCREAWPDLLEILRSYYNGGNTDSNPGVAHCFSGSLKEALELINMGFYIGVDGPLTYPKAETLRDIIKQIPVDNIVLETDSPYLPPQGYRGQRNEPHHIPLIGETLSQLKDCPVPEISHKLKINSLNLFRLNTAE